MRINTLLTDTAVAGELGARFERLRLNLNLTQDQLALRAGVSKRTIERFESGTSAPNFNGVIRLCRALGLMERLDYLVPEPTPSPMQQVAMMGKLRRRARQKRVDPEESARVMEGPSQWKWGDEK